MRGGRRAGARQTVVIRKSYACILITADGMCFSLRKTVHRYAVCYGGIAACSATHYFDWPAVILRLLAWQCLDLVTMVTSPLVYVFYTCTVGRRGFERVRTCGIRKLRWCRTRRSGSFD